uniref:Transmembrane protein n=1 Tax=Maylandia zebra TaxID=106582 RepID=A0A3P9ATD0_9CICH
MRTNTRTNSGTYFPFLVPVSLNCFIRLCQLPEVFTSVPVRSAAPSNPVIAPICSVAVRVSVEMSISLPTNKVTPEGLIFVIQWVLAALICYWLISLAFRLVASTLIDYNVGTEAMAIRLAVLLCVCVLLNVGTRGSSSAANQTARLEKQVKILERRLREMERWTRTEE